MKAVVYMGGTIPSKALKITEVEKPQLRDNQILIKVIASSLNIIDFERFKYPTKLSQFAKLINLIQGKKPVLGGEISGIVYSVGAKVEDFLVGDKVFGITNGIMQHGGWAEFAICEPENMIKKPEFLSFEQAAVIPISSIPAVRGINIAEVKSGDDVLVVGASGGVGLFTLKILKSLDTKIVAVCSTRNVKLVESFQVDDVIDYTKEDFLRSGKRFDTILNINGYRKIKEFRHLLKPEGKIVIIGNDKQMIQTLFYQLIHPWQKKQIAIYSTLFDKSMNTINQIKELVNSRVLVPHIDQVYNITDVSHAIDKLIDNHPQGKISLTMNFKGDKND